MIKETQWAWAFYVVLAGIAIVIIMSNGFTPPVMLALAGFGVLLLLFYKLTIMVDDRFVSYVFGIGIIRGRYALDQIEDVKPISYVPFGWGIRFRPGIIIYNVSGRRAVEVKFKNKKRRVWLGTNKSEHLAGFISSRLNTKK